MGVYKQKGSRYWWISIYRGKDKPRIQVSSGTEIKAEAEAVEAAMKFAQTGNATRDALITALDVLLGTDDRKTGIPICAIAKTYEKLPDLDIKPLTLVHRKSNVDHLSEFLAEHWPSIKFMHQISREAIVAYSDHLRAECKTGKSYNNRRGNIVTVFKSLLIRGGLSENVATLMQAAKNKESRSGRALSRSEEIRVFKAAKEYGCDWYELSLVARYTGLRYGDISKLRPENIVGRSIKLLPSKTAHHNIEVVIPLHQKLVDMFSERNLSGEWIFPGHVRQTKKNGTAFSQIIKKAEIDPRGAYLSFHCWRHTFRTRLAEAGVSQEVAKQLGGWTNDGTAQHYNHDLTQAEAAIKALV